MQRIYPWTGFIGSTTFIVAMLGFWLTACAPQNGELVVRAHKPHRLENIKPHPTREGHHTTQTYPEGLEYEDQVVEFSDVSVSSYRAHNNTVEVTANLTVNGKIDTITLEGTLSEEGQADLMQAHSGKRLIGSLSCVPQTNCQHVDITLYYRADNGDLRAYQAESFTDLDLPTHIDSPEEEVAAVEDVDEPIKAPREAAPPTYDWDPLTPPATADRTNPAAPTATDDVETASRLPIQEEIGDKDTELREEEVFEVSGDDEETEFARLPGTPLTTDAGMRAMMELEPISTAPVPLTTDTEEPPLTSEEEVQDTPVPDGVRRGGTTRDTSGFSSRRDTRAGTITTK